MKIHPGRHMADVQSGCTVFLIGLRVNKLWKLPRILWVNKEFNKMMKELQQQPELGLLHFESWFGNPTLMVQYWQSREHLFGYSRNPELSHASAWGKYMRKLGQSSDFGLWHETYDITPETSESMYLNMPPFGLGKAVGTAEKE